jgi:hypothetical protein
MGTADPASLSPRRCSTLLRNNAHESRLSFHLSVAQRKVTTTDPGKALAACTKLVRTSADGWVLTNRGSRLFHRVEQVYTHQYLDKTWKSSMETPRPRFVRLN